MALVLVLEEVAVDFDVLGQGLNDRGLTQASFPQLLLPKQPVKQLHLRGFHLHGAAPHPQRAAVVHLQASGELQLSDAISTLKCIVCLNLRMPSQ